MSEHCKAALSSSLQVYKPSYPAVKILSDSLSTKIKPAVSLKNVGMIKLNEGRTKFYPLRLYHLISLLIIQHRAYYAAD